MVIDRAVFRLCTSFQLIARNVAQTNLSLIYENATVLKFFIIHRQVQKSVLRVSSWTAREMHKAIQWWRDFCNRLGIDLNIQNPVVMLPKFLNMKTTALFQSTDILAFTLVLLEYSHKDDNILELVKKHFS